MYVSKVSICIQIKGKIYCKKIRDTSKGVKIDMLILMQKTDQETYYYCKHVVLFDRLLKENVIIPDISMIRYFDNELIFCMNTCIFISLFALNRKLSFVTITVWEKK